MKGLILFIAMTFSSVSFAECISKMSINGHEIVNGNQIEIYTTRGKYQMNVPFCFSLENADGIGFSTFSSFQICPQDDVLVFDGFTRRVIDRCRISSIVKIGQ